MFAYPIIRAILRAMMLSSETVFITCTVASIPAYSPVLYAVVYALTAEVYYRISMKITNRDYKIYSCKKPSRIPKIGSGGLCNFCLKIKR